MNRPVPRPSGKTGAVAGPRSTQLLRVGHGTGPFCVSFLPEAVR